MKGLSWILIRQPLPGPVGMLVSRIALACRFTWGRPGWVSSCLSPMMPRQERSRAAQGGSAALHGFQLEAGIPARQQAYDHLALPVNTWRNCACWFSRQPRQEESRAAHLLCCASQWARTPHSPPHYISTTQEQRLALPCKYLRCSADDVIQTIDINA